MKKNFFVIILLIISYNLYSQGEIDDQPIIVLRNERSWAFLINSNGLGANFTFAKRLDGYRHRQYTIDFVNFKHWKEVKSVNPATPNSTSRFVFGKTNFVLNLRAGYGMQKEIFSKQDKGSISIRYFYNIGPSIAFLKPIYYKVFYPDSFQLPDPRTINEKFNPNNPKHTGYGIIGKSSFFLGLNEIGLAPGGHAKLGFTFEYSKRDDVINAVEVGATIDGYIRGVEIMSKWGPDYFYYGVYIAYRFGKVIKAKTLKG